MGYKQGIDREQIMLMPYILDEYVGEENICRVIDLFVGKADLKAMGFKYAETKETGCPPYSPWAMSKLYLYGYQNRVRSSRRLESETHRNIEVMWLMERLTPDDKTISNFRKENAKALKGLYRLFVQFCISCELVGKGTESFDGTKIKANNSRRNHYTQKTALQSLARIEKKIDEYLAMLDENDRIEMAEKKPDKENLMEAINKLSSKKAMLEDILKEFETTGEESICTVDRDAKLMKQSGSKDFDVSYNVQTVTDEKHGLVVEYEVTNHAKDMNELSWMSEKAAEVLGTNDFKALADMGYCSGSDIKECEDKGVKCYIPMPEPGHQPTNPAFHRNKFTYDSIRDIYTCPCGHEMLHVRRRKRDGYEVYANRGACKICEQKKECTKSQTLREIERNPYQEYIERAEIRVKENRELYRRRQELSEPPFGVIKRIWGFDQYLCRGDEKVSGETALTFLAYNMRRVANIMGIKAMMEALA